MVSADYADWPISRDPKTFSKNNLLRTLGEDCAEFTGKGDEALLNRTTRL
jgi:hypothetical protein